MISKIHTKSKKLQVVVVVAAVSISVELSVAVEWLKGLYLKETGAVWTWTMAMNRVFWAKDRMQEL